MNKKLILKRLLFGFLTFSTLIAIFFILFIPLQMANDSEILGIKRRQFLLASKFKATLKNERLGDIVVYKENGAGPYKIAGLVGYGESTNTLKLLLNMGGIVEMDRKFSKAIVIFPKVSKKTQSNIFDEYAKTMNDSFDTRISAFQTQNSTLKNEIRELKNKLEKDESRPEYIVNTQYLSINEPGWVKLESNILGISLDYPLKHRAKVDFEYADFPDENYEPTGQYFKWGIKIMEDGVENYEWTYGSAGGISETFSAGRDYVFTDFTELKNISEKPENDTKPTKWGIIYYNPEEEMLYKTKYGTDAIVRSTPMNDYGMDLNQDGMTIYANLPIKKDPRFNGIAIYSPYGFSKDEIERIINSLTVE